MKNNYRCFTIFILRKICFWIRKREFYQKITRVNRETRDCNVHTHKYLRTLQYLSIQICAKRWEPMHIMARIFGWWAARDFSMRARPAFNAEISLERRNFVVVLPHEISGPFAESAKPYLTVYTQSCPHLDCFIVISYIIIK